MTTLTDWLGTFLNILIKPFASTFRKEAEKAEGKFFSATLWIVFAMLVNYAVGYFTDQIHVNMPVVFLVYSLLEILLFLFLVYFINLVSTKIFKVEHRGKELLYILVSVTVIVSMLMIPTIFLPNLAAAIFYLVLFAYIIFLVIMGIKSITGLKLWQTIVTFSISFIVFIIYRTAILIFLAFATIQYHTFKVIPTMIWETFK